MTEEQYNRMADRIRNHPEFLGALLLVNRIITVLTMASYPILLFWLWTRDQWELCYHCLLVPGVSFVVVSLYRKIYDAPRPYEQREIRPLISKDTRGKSFPSRHVFSIFMIGMTFLQVSQAAAVLLFVAGVFLGAIRVIGGVHYIRDVIAGAFMALLMGYLGFYVIF